VGQPALSAPRAGHNHIFVTQDYPPVGGGMARRYVELCRRFSDPSTTVEVSTVAASDGGNFDSGESYPIHRQPFSFGEANRFVNQVRWGAWLDRHCRTGVDVIHCGNIRPTGYAVTWPSTRSGIPYLLYVNGGDLLRERHGKKNNLLKRAAARRILGKAAGIVAISKWSGELAGEVMDSIGIENVPPIGAFDLGTDPAHFQPSRDTGMLRARWGVGGAPLLITVARLVPHKGQDFAIRALAGLREEFPDLRYVMVGTGHDEQRLRDLALEMGVAQRIIFAGALGDDELPEAYATSTVYVGLSRIDREINVEGFGISFVEAAACGVPSVAGDSGGVRSAVRDGETGIVVPPVDIPSISAAIASLLRDDSTRQGMGRAARNAVETHYNWDRVARDTREFTYSVVGDRAAGK
jgi:phosphatidylinositol alpha-1,6-mannosyltransferase